MKRKTYQERAEKSPLTTSLNELKSKGKIKRTMKVRVHMQHDEPDMDWDKKEMDRLEAEAKELEGQLKNFDDKKAAAQVRAALEAEIAQVKAHHMAAKARSNR